MESLYQNVPPEERKKLLKENAYFTQEKKFSRELEFAEIRDEENRYANLNREIKIMQDELDGHKLRISSKIKLLKKEAESSLEISTAGTRQVTEVCYAMRDVDAQVMRFYDKRGILIDERGLMPDEYQARMFVEKDGNVEPAEEGKPFDNPEDGDTDDLEEAADQVEEDTEEDEGIHTLSEVVNELDGQPNQETFMREVPDYQAAEERANETRKAEKAAKSKKK
jgi:hypothetical protein